MRAICAIAPVYVCVFMYLSHANAFLFISFRFRSFSFLFYILSWFLFTFALRIFVCSIWIWQSKIAYGTDRRVRRFFVHLLFSIVSFMFVCWRLSTRLWFTLKTIEYCHEYELTMMQKEIAKNFNRKYRQCFSHSIAMRMYEKMSMEAGNDDRKSY